MKDLSSTPPLAVSVAIDSPEAICRATYLDIRAEESKTVSRSKPHALRQARLADYIEITRPRIVATVALTAVTGFIDGSPATVNVPRMLALIAGVGLVSASATAINQVLERSSDALMHRTRLRPLAQARISCRSAIALASVMLLLGIALLGAFNVVSASLALGAMVAYAFVYTPLKRVSGISLYAGAIPGALPPLIGSVMAENHVSATGMILFAFLFVWQLPHFLAIGWLYREDYFRAGFHILSVEDTSGVKSAVTALLTSTMLLGVVAYAAAARLWNPSEALISAISVVAIIEYARRYLLLRSRIAAKRLFLCSNLCLLITMVALIVTATLRFLDRTGHDCAFLFR